MCCKFRSLEALQLLLAGPRPKKHDCPTLWLDDGSKIVCIRHRDGSWSFRSVCRCGVTKTGTCNEKDLEAGCGMLRHVMSISTVLQGLRRAPSAIKRGQGRPLGKLYTSLVIAQQQLGLDHSPADHRALVVTLTHEDWCA